jgi:hypothetical protein
MHQRFSRQGDVTMKGWRYRQPYRITDDDLGRDYRVIKTNERATIQGWDNDTVEVVMAKGHIKAIVTLRRALVEARIDSGAWERA